MDHSAEPAYGLWSLVILNSAIFILFAFSFFKPKTARDWRTFGGFSAFIVALFVEMYGFPLSIYFLSAWLGRHYPSLNLYSHDAGHLWHTLLGLKGNPHFDVFHIASNLLILLGFLLLASAWPVLYRAQRKGAIALSGPYASIRHPQYAGFVMIMFGFLLQWPTIPTLVMFPVLVATYMRLANKEEADTRVAFGNAFDDYAARVPAFFPRLFSAGGPQTGLTKTS